MKIQSVTQTVVFIWRKYKEHCLWYKADPVTHKVTLDQRSIHKTDCWGFYEWPFFLFNGFGLLIHFGLLVGLLIRVFINRNDSWFAEEQVSFRPNVSIFQYFSKFSSKLMLKLTAIRKMRTSRPLNI